MKFELVPSKIEFENKFVAGWICYFDNRNVKVYITDNGLMTKFQIVSSNLVVELQK
ncbi:hypothetical protein [Orenia metallireducens]|uniref:hypothetical protein n=1 Tax=Orenia metallireducens TaxID=1413210 RepID=UPI0015E59FDF|nr:hypothetical protein [Orenia metallireducens]